MPSDVGYALKFEQSEPRAKLRSVPKGDVVQYPAGPSQSPSSVSAVPMKTGVCFPPSV